MDAVGQLVEGELLHPILWAFLVEIAEAERLEVARHEPARALGVGGCCTYHVACW